MIPRAIIPGLTVTTLLCSSASASAQTDEALKFRLFLHRTFAQSQDVGDVEGHQASLVRFSGMASFPDGTVGTAYYVGTYDYTSGAGQWSVYTNVTLRDGSVLWYKAAGTRAVDGTKPPITGTLTVLGGKGRFESAKGDGTVTADGLTTLGPGQALYNDVTINLKR
jgi:hypothetical protein